MSTDKYDLSDEEINLISTFRICEKMSPEESSTLGRHLSGLHVSAGDILFTQNSQKDDHLFILLKGEVKITIQL